MQITDLSPLATAVSYVLVERVTARYCARFLCHTVLSTAGLIEYRYTITVTQLPFHNYRYTITVTQLPFHNYRYTITVTTSQFVVTSDPPLNLSLLATPGPVVYTVVILVGGGVVAVVVDVVIVVIIIRAVVVVVVVVKIVFFVVVDDVTIAIVETLCCLSCYYSTPRWSGPDLHSNP